MDRRTSQTVVQLVELLYAAASGDTGWEPFLSELTRWCCGHVAMLFVHDYRCGSVPFAKSCGLDETFEAAYKSRLGALNPWVAEQASMPEGSLVLSHRLAADATISSTEYFADFMRPVGIRYAIGSNILKSGDCTVKLGVLRGGRQGPMGERELGLFSALMPSLQAALRLRGRLAELQARTRLHWDIIESLPFGVIFLDDLGAALCMNHAAAEMAEAADGLAIDARGRVNLGRHEERQALTAAVVAAMSMVAPAAPPAVLAVHRPSGRHAYSIQVLGVRDTALSLGGDARVALFVCDPERRMDGLAARLPLLWGLTGAEARLTACLANGLTLREAAVRLRISEGTARVVSKRIFAKTGTRGQADLLRRVVSSAAVLELPARRQHRSETYIAANDAWPLRS